MAHQLAGEPDTDVVLSDVSEASLAATVPALGAVETVLADVSDLAQVKPWWRGRPSASAGWT